MSSGNRQVSRAVANLSRMTVGRLATQVVLVVSAVAIPRALGTEAFGRYAALVAVVVILEAVASGGLHMAEIRFLAPLWHQRRTEEAILLAHDNTLSKLDDAPGLLLARKDKPQVLLAPDRQRPSSTDIRPAITNLYTHSTTV